MDDGKNSLETRHEPRGNKSKKKNLKKLVRDQIPNAKGLFSNSWEDNKVPSEKVNEQWGTKENQDYYQERKEEELKEIRRRQNAGYQRVIQ